MSGRAPESVAGRFRAEIERSEAQGVSRDDMVLRLTLRDMSQLKRDPSLELTDIRFADGVMKYLGVTTVSGGVTASALGEAAAFEPAPEVAKAPEKKRAKAKSKAST